MNGMNVIPLSPLGVAEVQMFIILALLAILLVYPWARILEKAGKSKLLALLVFIPFGIFVLSWYLALTEWKR